MINRVVINLIEESQHRIDAAGVGGIDEVRAHAAPLIGYSEAVQEQTLELKRFLRTRLYTHYRVRRMSAKAERVVKDLFAVLLDDPRLLPPKYQDRVQRQGADRGRAARVVADYIAGMTDRFAILEHSRLFNPGELT